MTGPSIIKYDQLHEVPYADGRNRPPERVLATSGYKEESVRFNKSPAMRGFCFSGYLALLLGPFVFLGTIPISSAHTLRNTFLFSLPFSHG